MKQRIPCPLCKTLDQQTVCTISHRTIVSCKHDGLLFVNPPLSDREIQVMYNERYFDSDAFRGNTCIGYYAYIDEHPLLLSYFQNKITELERLGLKGKLLEIGCGHGFFLEAAKKSKFTAIGIDISKYAVKYAQKTTKVDARVMDLHKATFKKNTFAVVAAFQLIEHVQNPVTFLAAAHQLMKPGGTILLATPDAGGYLHTLLGSHWLSFKHREHLFFFSRKTMKQTLEQAGFTDIRFYKDETRWYPLRHIFGGIKYYLHGSFFVWLSDALGKLGSYLHILDLKLPLPLDTMIVTAKKSRT